AALEQGLRRQYARTRWNGVALTGETDHAFAVASAELPQLDEDRASRVAARRMSRARWIADIGASREFTRLVLKRAFQHEELLAARMIVAREAAARRITYD